MKLATLLLGAFGLIAVGCAAPAEDTASGKHELGLTMTKVSGTEVVGTLETQVGSVAFTGSVSAEGVFDIRFDREGRTLTSHVDWNKLENDLSVSDGSAITREDRFVLKALATVLEEEVGKNTKLADNLVRQAGLWGSHPEGKLVVAHIKADPERGWTRLCNGTSYRNFTYDGGGRSYTEYLKYGPSEGTNPCRSRCGPGCWSVGTSAWTVDCGEHDRCEQRFASSSCADEWTSASDDFTFASNCSY